MNKFYKSLLNVFIILFSLGCNAQSTFTLMPTSGNCALLLTLPVPYGVDVSKSSEDGPGTYRTGYNFIGIMSFTGGNSAKLSGKIINPTFNTKDSPYLASNSTEIINEFLGTISPLSKYNGFEGGYLMTFTGSIQGKSKSLIMTGVPTNSGKTIVVVLSDGTSPGPGSGVCQF
jgi:hypothetical protein